MSVIKKIYTVINNSDEQIMTSTYTHVDTVAHDVIRNKYSHMISLFYIFMLSSSVCFTLREIHLHEREKRIIF
jgi:hypothetical protein